VSRQKKQRSNTGKKTKKQICRFCGKKVPKNEIKKHLVDKHKYDEGWSDPDPMWVDDKEPRRPFPPVNPGIVLISKRPKLVRGSVLCSRCKKYFSYGYRFAKSNQGPVVLCEKCCQFLTGTTTSIWTVRSKFSAMPGESC
jgi:hypothetical protein